MHTYSWGSVKTSNPLYVERIKQVVNQELQAKGWQMVESGEDTTIFANGNVHNEKELETTYNDFGPGWGWGGSETRHRGRFWNCHHYHEHSTRCRVGH